MVVSLSIGESVVFYTIVFFISSAVLKVKLNNIFHRLLLASILPFFISGFRYNVGWDYGSYAWGYDLFETDVSILDFFKDYQLGDSIGLDLVQLLTKSMNSKFLFFAITAMLALVPVFLFLLEEWDCEKNILQLAAFATCYTLLFTEYSAIKQGIAIGFCVYSLKYVFRRKPINYLICILIAFMFHASALVFIPVYFFWSYERNVTGWKKILIIIVSILFVLFSGEILTRFGGDRFSGYATQIIETGNLTFYLMVMWLIIFLVCRRTLLDLDKRNELLILLYAIGTIFMLFGFRNAFVKRIAYYFDVTQILLIPQLMYVFNKRSRKVAKILIGIYFILRCVRYNTGTATNMAPIPYSFLF